MTKITCTYAYPADGRGYPESGLTALEVAQARLSHDGHRYDLRREEGGWQLYVSQGSVNSAAGKMVAAWDGASPYGKLLFSRAATESDAWDDLAPRIVTASWSDVPEAMTDADYQAMMAEG
ncbi:hypothetical protein [Zavarzinia aquatilis]|uniref:Uncharacterized protein n=1 Tax=Zavarzinia aquatilis TaxID=2211142 RepID=A0A317EHB7_9PROT|nr:hypothetical protein [Zavarzinia aquatilis]PWR24595.1 hypothetical protein DKG74_07255 [Zavarzinia aquatilis]